MTHIVEYPENEDKVSVWATEAEALLAQDACYTHHMGVHNDNPTYTAQTVRWAIPRQRLDGKWTVPVCHHSDTSGANNLELIVDQVYPSEE